MSIDLLLAQMVMEGRVKDALREAERAQLVRRAKNSKSTPPFLLAAMQHSRDWQDSGNGRKQPTMDNMRPRKSQQNLTG
jgi:hypothetical protein